MTTMTITVTRALAMLKSLGNQIDAATNARFIGVAVGRGPAAKAIAPSVGSVAEVSAMLQGNYDAVISKINQYQKIKSALVLSNASVKVKVNGSDMTVAEAIELKTFVTRKQTLLNILQQQFTQANNSVTAANTATQAAIDKILETMAGGDKAKVDTTSAQAVTDLQLSQKEATLIDPVKVASKIKALQDEIDAVNLELDFTLSEINSKTELTINL